MKHLSLKTFVFLSGALAASLLSPVALAQQTNVWNGSVDGNWTNAANWNSGPGNDTQTILSFGSAGPLTSFIGATRTINSIEFDADVSRNIRLTTAAANTATRTLIFGAGGALTHARIEVKAGSTGTLYVGHGDLGQLVLSNANLHLVNNGSGSLTIGAEIVQSGTSITNGDKYDVVKDGSGQVWIRTSLKHYGNTVVQAGMLSFNDLGSITFRIGENGVNNKITGGGSFTSNGEFLIDLTGAGTTAGESWTLVDSVLHSVAYGNLFNVKSTLGDFTKEGSLWTISENNTLYQFSQDTGMLTVVVPEPSSAFLLGFGVLALVFVRSKRRKAQHA